MGDGACPAHAPTYPFPEADEGRVSFADFTRQGFYTLLPTTDLAEPLEGRRPEAGMSYSVVAVLDHPARRRIYEHLLLLPGDHFRSIVRTLRLSIGVVRHHLGVLVRSGIVYEEKAEGRVRYYPRGGAVTVQLTKLYRKHWKYRDLGFRVLLAVHAVRQAQPATVARNLGISRQLAAYHLSRLAKRGQIRLVDGSYQPR